MSRFKARLAGVFYLLTIVVGVIASFAPSRQLSDVGNLIGTAFYIIVTTLLYFILKPVNASLSLIAGLISLAGCTVGALEALHRSPFSFNGIVIFGFYCLLLGYLIFRSVFSRAGWALSSRWLASDGSPSSGQHSPNTLGSSR